MSNSQIQERQAQSSQNDVPQTNTANQSDSNDQSSSDDGQFQIKRDFKSFSQVQTQIRDEKYQKNIQMNSNQNLKVINQESSQILKENIKQILQDINQENSINLKENIKQILEDLNQENNKSFKGSIKHTLKDQDSENSSFFKQKDEPILQNHSQKNFQSLQEESKHILKDENQVNSSFFQEKNGPILLNLDQKNFQSLQEDSKHILKEENQENSLFFGENGKPIFRGNNQKNSQSLQEGSKQILHDFNQENFQSMEEESKQIFQDRNQENSQSLEKTKVISQNNVTNDSFGETVNPDAETTMGTQNASSTPKELIQPQEYNQNNEEELKEDLRSPLKFSDFLYKKERHSEAMKIIQKGEEAQTIKRYLTIINSNLQKSKITMINNKIQEISQKSEKISLMSEIFENLNSQNTQFVDDRDRFEPLNDGQIIAIQLYHYCVFDLEGKGKAMDSINLINPVNIIWIEPLPQVEQVNEHFIRLKNLEHEEKFKELCGEEQLKQYTDLKEVIFDYFTNILELVQQRSQNETQFESQDEEVQTYVDEIIDQLKSIENQELYHFLNEAIYKVVDELSLSSYFDGKLEKPIENLENDIKENSIENIEKDEVVLVNFSGDSAIISDNISETEILKLPLSDQEQAKVDDDIKDFLQNGNETEEEFVQYLIKTYKKLQDIEPQVISYLQSLKEIPSVSKDNINSKDKLVKINEFVIKQKIIEWLKKNERKVPTNRQCQKEYGFDQEQIEDFQKCFQEWNAISFEEDDLFPEEIESIFSIFREETNFQNIQDQTLIEINLIKKFFVKWTSKLKQETELLKLMIFYGRVADSSFYVELILNDNQDELLKILLLIYKKSKKDYQKVTDTLRKYTQKFENYELEKIIKLAKEDDLSTNSQKQYQVKEMLEYFLKNDIIVYLMILHEFLIKGKREQQRSYFEEIILQEKHQKVIPAIAQLLILDKNSQLKAKVAESGLFIDYKNEQVQIEKQLEEQLEVSIQHDERKDDFISVKQMAQVSESDNIKLVDTIKRLAKITNKKIKIHLMSELKLFMVYKPEKEQDQSTLLLVRDDINKFFHVMIQYENEKKQIDFSQLQDLKKKLPFLSKHLPLWLDIFIQLPSLRRVLLVKQDLQTPIGEQIVVDLLETISKIQNDFLQFKTPKYKKELLKVATQLWNLDNQLLQEWFRLQQKNERMKDFCSYMITESARQNSYWAFNQVSSLQEYFPMDPLKMTLKDFNRVQTRSELNQRKETIQLLKNQPKELAKFIINTIFGFILRKEDLNVIQSELQQVVIDSPISLRFLIAYLIQSSDMGLRARLSYYLCQNKAVPLIMNCQETYKDLNFNMKYNQELIFSMDEVEGVGVFSFGIGKTATYPCGKSEISNMIVTPKFDNKSFDTNDINVLSNGQIDLFLDKCYQKKNGWAYMDGQGEIPNKNLQSVLPLTNIVLIHFFEQDKNDIISVGKLQEILQMIKQSDNEILICFILRDCSVTKEFAKSDYPEWLPMKDKVDNLISLVDLNQDNKINKLNEIEKVLLYFNTKVRDIQQIHTTKSKCKFTKERFLKYFCQSDEKGKSTYLRISEILKLSQDFLQEVQKLDSNVFNENGLPSLKIKDEIRAINLKLRSFQVQDEEDQQSAAIREKQLLDQVKFLNTKLQELEMNTLMNNFWYIENHKDAVLIKIQISKLLADFTQKKTSHLVKKKDKLNNQYGTNTSKKEEGLTYREIQDANEKFQEEIKKIEQEIFETSLSCEYFWRSLICFISDSKKFTYWNNEMEKLNFTQAVRQQMLDGDTFELIDGRNLEMRGDIIRQILGNEIECAKCIVACVIGPQSTGKSTLMNFCFGTQFLASTGRCTQGIYFTLQRIPPELKKGKDVEYLIILDTEGLNSPERAEPEYDRKIVIFTLLCSDFLIINSKGDMSYQMKELIKICAVRYDQLRGNAKVPKILYTFVQNTDTNPANFIAQISSLKSDVIECSTTQTVKKTTDELMTVHENLVKVMASAFSQKLIEKDDSKGLFQSNQIIFCEEIFGQNSSQVWLEVQNLFLQKDYQFRQIGTWLTEAQDHWTLIERHGAKLIEHENVIAMKNDTKMKEFFTKLWNEYLETKITAKDNQKSKENSKIIFDLFLTSKNLNEEKEKFIQANNEEKSKHYEQMWSQFEKWKQEPSQRSLTQNLEKKYNDELKKKMNVLKDSFKLLLENRLKEIQMMQITNNGISDLFNQARLLNQTLKQEKSANKDKLIDKAFKKAWDLIMIELSGQEQIEKLRQTSCEYLTSTFRNVNAFMSNIKPQEYNKIVEAAKSDDLLQDQDLPKQLVSYLVDHISGNAFIDDKGFIDPKDMFKFDAQMLGLLKEPTERIFSEKEKDKYLPLQKLLKVNYKYKILKDMVTSLRNSTIYEQIKKELNQVKQTETKYFNFNIFGKEISYSKITEEDDKEEIVNGISTLFQELGQAGFGFKQPVQKISDKDVQTEQKFILLSQVDIEEELNINAVFGYPKKKEKWVEDLKKRITWQKSENIVISSRIESILKYSTVHFANQLHPKISFEKHLAESKEIQNAMWRSNKPELSYVFSDDDVEGKINFENFLKDRNLLMMYDCYFQCLVNPVKYEMAESQKWTYLSKLTSMLIDWEKIVLTINEKVSKEIIKVELKSFQDLQAQNNNQINTEFDLKNVLERNQITLEQAERIQINQLQGIKQELDDELHRKLALFVHPTLSGVMTWVACVIIWYKSQKNILTKFNEQQKKLEIQMNAYKENFRDIALGKTETVTKQGARQIFNETFKEFNENCKNIIIKNIGEALESKNVLDKFDTDKVYDEMDKQYICSATADDYEKFISYVLDPVKSFESYVDSLSLVFDGQLETIQMKLYKDRVNANLNKLKKRLGQVQILISSKKQWDESVKLFEIQKVGETTPLKYQEKKNIESAFSSIYLNTLKSILEGKFKICKQEVTLKVHQIETQFIFTAMDKDPEQKEIVSPFQELQDLQFEEDKNDEFLEIFLMRLGSDEKNFGLCSDLRVMIENLILIIDSKISEVENLTLNDIYDINQQVKSLKDNAIGCRILCYFCNRKCEHKPHNDSKDGGTPHSCEKRGHQFRVFAGGCLKTSWEEKLPSLLTCDEILPSTHIKITNDNGTETRIWSEIHEAMNRNWITNYNKFENDGQPNLIWSQMHDKLDNFWKILGEKYCQQNQYKYIQTDETTQITKSSNSQMSEKSILILCLDDSGSMFEQSNDFSKAVEGGKEVEKYLKDMHENPNQVHVQLWYNDCDGVTQAYKGQLSGVIPNKAWTRQGCQSDKEINGSLPAGFNYGKCGQFTGAIRILNQEVNNLLEQDPSYQRVYWFMFSDGGNKYPVDELAKFQKTIKDNPQKWTDSTGTCSKLIPLIITNQRQVEPLVKISNKLNLISKAVWQVDNFCSLRQDVKIDLLASTMIESFIIN